MFKELPEGETQCCIECLEKQNKIDELEKQYDELLKEYIDTKWMIQHRNLELIDALLQIQKNCQLYINDKQNYTPEEVIKTIDDLKIK